MGMLDRESFYEDDAVYWPPESKNDLGEIEYGQPVDLKVKWFDSTSIGVGPDGRETIFNATIIPREDLELDGMIMKGSTADLTTPLAHDNENAKTIRMWTRINKRRKVLRVASI